MLFIISCSSDDSTIDDVVIIEEEPVENILFLRTARLNGEIIQSYGYDSQTRVIRINGSLALNSVRVEIEYDANKATYNYYSAIGAVIKKEIYYNEQNNTFRVEDAIPGADGFYSYGIFNKNLNSCDLQSFSFFYANDEPFYEVSFSYLDDSCSNEANYTYPFAPFLDFPVRIITVNDDKNRSNKAAIGNIYKNVNLHNVLSSMTYNINNELRREVSYTSTFEYNEQEYPINETRTFLDGNVSIYTYEYY
ncbi:MAG: hypothetical protein ACJAX3_002103 [Patiriisocius sp.]|jgi:hypothetical protein